MLGIEFIYIYIYIYIYTHTHTHTYTYIYIYIIHNGTRELSPPGVPNPTSAVKKFQIFYRIWKCITLFTDEPLWGPPWTRQSSKPHPGNLSLIGINMDLTFSSTS